MSRTAYDVLVVGGGPAGLAAAATAAELGLRVGVVDERPTAGGQIFKQPGPGFVVRDERSLGRDFLRGRALIAAAERSGAELMLRTSAVDIRGTTVVLVPEGGRASTVEARAVVLAAGAYDRAVAFPGWTLPGVVTAGGAQTLVKTQRVLPGERIVFAGSGPLALAFPAQLRGYGAQIALVLEAGPPPRADDVLRLVAAARGNTALLRDAARYRAALLRARVPLRYRRIVVRAEGDGRVEQVVHAAADENWRPLPGSEEHVRADTLCVGYGFFPSVELLRLAGCALTYDEDLGGLVPLRDDWLRTTVPGVFAAGDGSGVTGSYAATDEGRLAAIAAAADLGTLSPAEATARARPCRRRLRQQERFRAALRRLHRVGAGIHELATPDTVVCRCEEVTAAQLHTAVAATADINVVKMLTRVTMGLCQGRNCERHVSAALARHHHRPIAALPLATARAPVRPVPIGAVADASIEDERFFALEL
jgi:D-hydroxyproline dehydrogenase subunit alpha